MNYIFSSTNTILILIIGILFFIIIISFLYSRYSKPGKVIPQTKTERSYFGYNIKFLRIKNLISLKKLEDDTGISIDQLANIENNNANPHFDEIKKLADYFQLSTAEIVYIDLVDNYVKNYISTESSNDTKDLF